VDLIIHDLQAISSGLSSAATSSIDATHARSFLSLKQVLSKQLASVREDINRLVTMQANLPNGSDRTPDSIRLKHQNAEKLKSCTSLWLQLRFAMESEEKQHHQQSVDSSDFEDRKAIVKIFAEEIRGLVHKNSGHAVEVKNDVPLAAEIRKPARSGSRETKRGGRNANNSSQDSSKSLELQPLAHDGVAIEIQSLSGEHQAFLQQHAANEAEQEQLLDQLDDYLAELKGVALDMNNSLDIQRDMLQHTEQKVEENNDKLRAANRGLRKILEDSGWGCSRIVPMTFCVILLLALLGTLWHMMRAV
jgi:hypothetical protein